ncbi:hypothetical protein VTO73DRAFT_12144 [Trametes versicolor]
MLRDVTVGASSRYGRATRTSLFSLDAHSLACGSTRRGSGHRLCYQYLALCPTSTVRKDAKHDSVTGWLRVNWLRLTFLGMQIMWSSMWTETDRPTSVDISIFSASCLDLDSPDRRGGHGTKICTKYGG